MIGILINRRKIDFYSKFFFRILQCVVDPNDKEILLFSIENLNIKNKTIYGNLITVDNINPINTSIPKIIFNFSRENSKIKKRKIRLLAEYENTILINESNTFNQEVISEILASNQDTNVFRLPDLLKSCKCKNIITVYMQKNIEGKWIPILGTDDLAKKITESSVMLADYVSNFISRLGFCTISFIIDKEGSLYLISFEGFDIKHIAFVNNHKMQNKFMNNIFNYAKYLSINQEEVIGFVD
ncbi:MAG: hypothetical protein FWC47_06170 [Oscillospiraceae bacterium]|nr:hypothetical protein [Oscillospiraceae bacterium]